jgi:hypothetical protein
MLLTNSLCLNTRKNPLFACAIDVTQQKEDLVLDAVKICRQYILTAYAVGRNAFSWSLVEIPVSAVSTIRGFSKTMPANHRSFTDGAFPQCFDGFPANRTIDWLIDRHNNLPRLQHLHVHSYKR